MARRETRRDAAVPVTLAQLGRVLDLDKSTVSLALRGSERIAEDTRRRVREAAERMGYRPNLAARQLKGGGPPTVLGLYLPGTLETLLTGVAVRTIQVLSQLAADDGMVFQLLTRRSASSRPGLDPDVALVWGDTPYDEAREVLAGKKRALVIDPNHLSYANYKGPAVRLDNRGVGAELARHLVERGAQRLLVVRVNAAHLGHGLRWEGARAEWIRHRGLGSVSMCEISELSDERLAELTRERGSAILCTNDAGGIVVWRRLQRLGARFPEDMRLASINGEPWTRALGLTTALFDSEGLARAAYAALLHPPERMAPADVAYTLAPGETT
jgi:DNA-binding LacI/PurR family transcriptional regulator